ncbi:iron ABC transporter permease [Paenibacillus spiritus]|uniref:Iron ABC transporter permease n=1 Tax=Paenibacillus spiritus TaxID=2496557 RepID=A0A5J5GES4_9BACL|nr:iron ABC transporter permease [Paenibacillus spiritus]KAA9006591.1 iron ABC transporter permease [Paenibacillus spiritus]
MRRRPVRAGGGAGGMAVVAVLALLVAVVAVLGMNTGYMKLSAPDVLRTLAGKGSPQQHLILFDFRLPRITVALLVGAGFAVSGCVLQSLARNALAEPATLGITAGAGLAVILFISYFPAVTAAPVYVLPALALGGAAAAAALIYLLAYRKGEGAAPTRLILSGIALTAGINAVQIVWALKLNPQNYAFVATWIAGKIWGGGWPFVWALLPWAGVLLPLIFLKARVLNALNLGDAAASGIGVAVGRERLLLMGAAVALAGACVAVSGGIGFVGLIAPHLARRLVGPRHQILLPASALTGSLLLLAADTIGRWIMQPAEIPAGVVVAVIGAPYFLYLLARAKA